MAEYKRLNPVTNQWSYEAALLDVDGKVVLSPTSTVAVAAGATVALVAGTTVNSQQGTSSALNLTVATLVKASAGRAARVSVLVAGTVVGSVNDAATVVAAAAANQLFVIPNTVGVYLLDWPCSAGIVVTPGTGQTVAVSFV